MIRSNLSSLVWYVICLAAANLLAGTPEGQAQLPQQTLRGSVSDRETAQPLEGVSIQLLPGATGSFSDEKGGFRFENLQPGRYTLLFSMIGYEPVTLPQVEVNSGKETVLEVLLKESPTYLKEIVVVAKEEDRPTVNEYALVSGRQFSLQEGNRYAGGYNDPSRMVMSFAGVTSSGNDDNNEIVIRGNSPKGLLWRLEGIEIPNPNHFGDGQGSTSGIISMVNSTSLANSDFFTGAFPPEYGNALSGVFDLRFRTGNDQRREWKGLLSVVGLEAAAEGPLGRNGSSYRVNARYSTLELLLRSGLVNIEAEGFKPAFRDYNFTFAFPTKALGKFKFWGIGGRNLSEGDYPGFRDTDENGMSVVGLSHQLPWKGKGYFYTVAAFSGDIHRYFRENQFSEKWTTTYKELHRHRAMRFSSFFNQRLSSSASLRTGFILSRLGYEYDENRWDGRNSRMVNWLREDDATGMFQAYSQLKWQPSAALTLTSGIHYHHFKLTQDERIEPRFGAQFKISENSALNAGFGLHSRLEPISLYLYKRQGPNNTFTQPNSKLKSAAARHVVVGYTTRLSPHTRLIAEAYLQRLFQVPVDTASRSFFSILNSSAGIPGNILENSGKGRNTGLELTLERFLADNYYFLFTASLFNSRYIGKDGIWRNTIFNNSFAGSGAFGKESPIGKSKQHFLSYNLRLMLRGGNRYIPFNIPLSVQRRSAVTDNSKAYEAQLPPYWRIDAGFGYKRNKARSTWTFRIDLQNATNRKNPIRERFDTTRLTTYYNYALPIIPIFGIQVEFY
jgi:hypothetical protein